VRIILTSRQPMFLWWGEQLINLYNDGYAAFLHAKHPAALCRPAAAVWPEIWDQVEPRAKLAMHTVEGTYDEALPFVMYRKGYAEETYVTFSYSPIPDDDGGFGGILCPVTEETERMIGERQMALLRELAARTGSARTCEEACALVASAIETDPDDVPFALIYLIDAEKRVARLSGTSNVSRGSEAALERVHLDGPCIWPLEQVWRNRVSLRVSDLGTVSGKLPLLRKQYPVTETIAIPILSSDAGPGGVLIAALSPLRSFDDSYSQFLDLVASRVSAAITNGQAYEAERQRAEALAEIDRAKTAFFSNVSHEFRTPLTLMLGPIEQMLARADGTAAIRHDEVELLHRNSLRLLKLVNALLDFSRIEAGRMNAFYEATDLAAFTAELASQFRSAVDSAGLTLVVNCPPLREPVYVDRGMWEKIVLNLISNALKFTMQGQIAVSMRTAAGFAELSVRDTGVGIPEQELPRVFERFHRVQGVEGRSYDGSGIGLAMVQELTHLHGGTVQAESTLGHGSRFTVSIPLGHAHLPAERVSVGSNPIALTSAAEAFVTEASGWLPEPPRITPAGQGAPFSDVAMEPETHIAGHGASGVQARILLADDNADMRRYMLRVLEGSYRVDAVHDGQDAFASARADPPDLILTDIMMPRMDGIQLLQQLRNDARTRHIPVVLISARAGEEARVQGLETGADEYLVKPFSTRELLVRVRSLVLLKRTREALQRELLTKTGDLSELTNALIVSRNALRRSEAYLAQGERISHTGSYAWNPLTGELVWSKEHCRIFGVPPDEQRQTYESFLNKVHHEDREFVRRAVDLATEQRTNFDLDYPIVRPDGRIRHIHALGRPAEGTDSSAELIGAVVDITERKKAEEKLRRSEAYLAESERLSHTGSWAWNVTTGALFWSEEHYRIRLVPGEGGPSLSEGLRFIHPDDRNAVQEALERAVRDRADFDTDCRIVRPDGMVRYIHSRARPVFDTAGRLIEFVGTIIDNTERKQAHDALQKAQAELAHMARVTTMGELAASIAHKVNQPLSAVITDAAACLSWLDRPQPNVAEASTAATRLMDQAIRASEVTSRIRLLLKKSQPQKSVVYLNELINEVLTLTRYEILSHNIAAETELANDLLEVRGDPVQLKQVLANLVVNAIEAIRESTGPSRSILIVSENSASDEILVAVNDSGVGIDLKTTEELFMPFITHKPEGLGMGLAISRSIIEAHGGRLWATVNEQRGATFQFSLPALRAT
jgi:PAS domain S-box-containing protein